MKRAFSWLLSMTTHFWRTLVSTFCKGKDRYIYKVDVDNDGFKEIVLDPNGRASSSQNIETKEE